MRTNTLHLRYWLHVAALIVSFECISFPDAAAKSEDQAFFGTEKASDNVHLVANWVVKSHDNHGMPFVILDKKQTEIFTFDADGQIAGAARALLGMAEGDCDVEGIGSRSLAQIPPKQRITPAGRYIARLGKNGHGGQYLWVDYDANIAIHPVVNVPGQRRLERIASPDPKEHRISWGCINVPASYFETIVFPLFKKSKGIVYILPETKSPIDFFGITPDYLIQKK